MTGHADPDLAARWVLARPGSRTEWAVVKLGKEGALLRSKVEGRSYRMEGLQVGGAFTGEQHGVGEEAGCIGLLASQRLRSRLCASAGCNDYCPLHRPSPYHPIPSPFCSCPALFTV